METLIELKCLNSSFRAQMCKFEFFEMLLLKLEKQLPVEQFEATASQSTLPSPSLPSILVISITTISLTIIMQVLLLLLVLTYSITAITSIITTYSCAILSPAREACGSEVQSSFYRIAADLAGIASLSLSIYIYVCTYISLSLSLYIYTHAMVYHSILCVYTYRHLI